MAGLVIGGLGVFLRQRVLQFQDFSTSRLLPYVAAALAISCPAVFILLSVIPLDHVRMLWEKVQLVYLAVFILLCTTPFFLYGVFISLALSAWPKKANRVYASDLLGGAAGLLAVVMLMNSLKIEYIVVILMVVVGSVVVSAFGKTVTGIALASLLAGLCIPVALEQLPFRISPYKGLIQALNDDDARHIDTIYSSHSQLDLFENPRMKFAPGLSLAFTDTVPRGIGMALDGDIVGVVMDGKDTKSYTFLAYMPSSLPYLLIQPEKVIVIGARNGVDLLQPGYFGVSHVHVAEHDASVLKSLAAHQEGRGTSSMPLFDGSGRNLLKSLPPGVGLIFLSRTGFFPSGSFGLQEDYDLTVEAIETYMRWLNADGVLFVQMFLLPPPRLELRLANNIRAVLNKMGIQEIHKHLLVYRSWDTVNFLIKRDSFSETDLRKVSHFLASRQFDLLYPHMIGQEKYITGLDYQGLFYQVLQSESFTDFSSSYIFDIRKTTDDRPFFHYFLRLDKIGEIYELSGKKWAYFLHEGMFLPFTLLLLMFLALAIFFIVFLASRPRLQQLDMQNSSTLRSSKTTATEDGKLKAASLAYFVLIGFAFMFFEVFFIHRLILPFGSAVRAFSITLVTILLSAGIGSMIVGWIGPRKMPWVMGIAPLLAVGCYFLFDLVNEARASAFILVPIGIALGFFFPAGIRYLIGEKTGGVSLAYATNGAASIIAPPLASLLAVSYGCNVLLILAAILHSLAVVIILPIVLRISRSSGSP
jgi:hypothetical protein